MTAQQFYLGGGTALAIHLGHRRSVDFDWFTRERIADPLRLAHDQKDHCAMGEKPGYLFS
jgi:hypothetical protein